MSNPDRNIFVNEDYLKDSTSSSNQSTGSQDVGNQSNPSKGTSVNDPPRKTSSGIFGFFKGENPIVHSISKWKILLIVLILVVIGIVLIWLTTDSEMKINQEDKSKRYKLVWGDNFHFGTPRLIDDEFQRHQHHYPNVYCRKNSKCLPNIDNWTVQKSEGKNNLHGGDQVFTDNYDNVMVKDNKLILRLIDDKTEIIDNEGSRRYNHTSAKVISRDSFTGGFFLIRAKVNQQEGMKAKIGLLPYYNLAMNQVGSRYGRWPACGEIEFIESRDLNPHFSHGLYFGGEGEVFFEADETHCPIDWSQWHVFGLEWTENYIAWHIGSDISKNGYIIDGQVVATINTDEWFSLTRSKRGPKKRLPPAPFNRPFHIVISLEAKSNDSVKISESSQMEIDWIKVYQNEISKNMDKSESDESDSSDSDDPDDYFDTFSPSSRGGEYKVGPLGF